jgi:hypothetical protein
VDGEGFVGNDVCGDGRSECPDGADAGHCVAVATVVDVVVFVVVVVVVGDY